MALDDIFDPIPLQAGEPEDARSVDRIAPQSHALEVEVEAKAAPKSRESDLCDGGSIVLQQLMPGTGFVFRCLRSSDAEPVRK